MQNKGLALTLAFLCAMITFVNVMYVAGFTIGFGAGCGVGIGLSALIIAMPDNPKN